MGFTAPSANAVVPINSELVISGTCPPGSAVQVYRAYPADPIGAATVVGSSWSISFTPDLTQAGSYTLYATDGVTPVTRDIRITLVPDDGTWSTNSGGWLDLRAALAAETVGATLPNMTPQEGTGTFTGTNSPLVATGTGSRKCADLVLASAHYFGATSGSMTQTPNGTTAGSFIFGVRANVTTGSGTLFGWGRAGSNNDYFKVTTSAGKVLSSIQRKAGADAAQTAAPASTYDLDVPSLQTRTIETQFDASTGTLTLYINGVLDSTSTLTVTASSLASDLIRLGAWPLNSNAQNSSGQYQVVYCKRVAPDGASGALARHNWIVASELVAPTGAGLQFLGDSTMLGQAATGGCRKGIMDAIAGAAYTVSAVGPRAYGGFTQNQCNAQGGNNMSAVRTQQITPYVGTGKGFESIQRTFVIVGTNDVDEAAITAATCVSRWRTTMDLLQTAAATSKSNHRIYASTFLPYDPASNAAAAANVAAVNGGLLQAEVASFNAANPSNQIILVDSYAALGSGWNSTDMADDRHPSQTGYNKIAAAMFAACSADLATLVP